MYANAIRYFALVACCKIYHIKKDGTTVPDQIRFDVIWYDLPPHGKRKDNQQVEKLMNKCKLPDVTDVGHTHVCIAHLTHTSPNTIWEYTANFASS